MVLTRGVGVALAVTMAVGAGGLAATAGADPSEIDQPPTFAVLGSYSTGLGNLSGESVAFAPGRGGRAATMYVTNSGNNSLDIVNVSDPATPARTLRIPLGAWGAGPNSVDVSESLVAVAVESNPKTDPGTVVFFRHDGTYVAHVTVGALPDMVAFTDDGDQVVVANEGEPSGYNGQGVDPEGSISIISTERLRPSPSVKTVSFSDFNAGGPRNAELPAGIRLNGPGASVAQDLEPEYVTIEGGTAFVTLQENNAIAEIKLGRGRVAAIRALGTKDHSVAGNGFDATDRPAPGAVNIRTWPVKGLYMPDGISHFRAGGKTYLITANEGDAREWPGLPRDDPRARDQVPATAPIPGWNAALAPETLPLRDNNLLGRLRISRTDGLNAAGQYGALYSFGARSATIWSEDGAFVSDTGDMFEQKTSLVPNAFNTDNSADAFDSRSPAKGPEPEGVAVGKIDGHRYAFVGLERPGGFMVLDVTDPAAPTFVQWANNRTYPAAPSATPAGPDLGPEIIRFVDEDDSLTDTPLVIVANEVSGTVTIYEAQ
jgi:LVIVD repeat